jgi:hypothetical protein
VANTAGTKLHGVMEHGNNYEFLTSQSELSLMSYERSNNSEWLPTWAMY